MVSFFIPVLCFLFFIPTRKCPPPARPANVPEHAKWCGDCDGGEWIYLVSDSTKYHFIIYNDYSGEIRINGIFKPIDNVPVSLNQDNWNDMVLFYTNDIDGLLKIIIQDSCAIKELVCQYPAYGGSDWQTTKEKEDLTY